MIVLSLFDGISCGRLALEKAGIEVTRYYASEINKYALAISKKNYPNIIQLGDINNFCQGVWLAPECPTAINSPDVIIGGSPCQGFSFAGKQLAFDDPRSKLFFKYVEVLEYYKPKFFLFENVRMKKEYQDVISKYLGVEPVCINSALVSAQNRVRYYWTNIPNITQPENRGILLKDILEEVGEGWIKNKNTYYLRNNKSMCIDANYHKGQDNHGQRTIIKCGSLIGRKIDPTTFKRSDNGDFFSKQRLELRADNKSGTLTSVQKDNLIVNHLGYRKLTPIECERLQTIPDNYTQGVSNTQRYKMLGNAWTVDVITHILKNIYI